MGMLLPAVVPGLSMAEVQVQEVLGMKLAKKWGGIAPHHKYHRLTLVTSYLSRLTDTWDQETIC